MRYLFYCLFAVCLCTTSSFAQSPFAGSWEGTLDVGAQLRLVVHITDTKGTLSATMDSPDQGAAGIPVSKVTVRKDSILMEVANINGQYRGKKQDDTHITGCWMQGGAKFPLNLKKGDKPTVVNRPQEPKPPFPYNSEDVIYTNADNSIQFDATITAPKDNLRHAAVLLITGSGSENRDEELFGHKPFAVIADYLSRRGYIVLRVDDRGVGKTTGDAEHATSADLAQDVNAGINYLKTRQEVDTQKLGLLGHSEGGMIAPMVADARRDVDFIILLAGPGVPTTQLMREQGVATMKSMGAGEAALEKYSALYYSLETAALQAKDTIAMRRGISDSVANWIVSTPKDIVMGTTGIHDNPSREHFVDMFVQAYSNDWFRYFLAFDPQPYLQKLSCKVLALNGDKDIQVLSKSNLAGMRESLAKSKSKVHDVIEVPGVNHLFQKCTTCTVAEYGQIEETIDPDVLKIIGDWMDKHVK